MGRLAFREPAARDLGKRHLHSPGFLRGPRLGAAVALRNGDLHRLFGDGPVTQASRLASLPTPAYAMDPSFGSSY